MTKGYQSFLTKEQLVYNILYQVEKNPEESLGEIIEKILNEAKCEEGSD